MKLRKTLQMMAVGLFAAGLALPASAQNSGGSAEPGQPSKPKIANESRSPKPPGSADPLKTALTSKQLLILLSGNSLAGNGKIKDPKTPYDWVAHYKADGILTMKLKPAWGGLILVGRWWMKPGGLTCRIFTKPQKKPEGCWRFFREGDFYRFVPASGQSVEGRAVSLKGNAITK